VKTHRNPDFTISVPPRSVGEAIHRAIESLWSGNRWELIDLRADAMSFVSPSEMVGLRLVVESAALVADVVRLACPVDPDVHGYLSYMNLFEGLPDNVRINRPAISFRRLGRSKTLIELAPIRDSARVDEFMERTSELLMREYGPGRGFHMAAAIAEVAANVIDHAQARVAGQVCAQRYRHGLDIAIGDVGVGIPASLRANPAFGSLTDVEAIRRALDQGVSSLIDPDRGLGLPELVHRSRQLRGYVRILSGSAGVEVDHRYPRERIKPNTYNFRAIGTWIFLRFKAGDPAEEAA
jgi:anti-sigma regulatory factor (Ser/Thr protein kinase)